MESSLYIDALKGAAGLRIAIRGEMTIYGATQLRCRLQEELAIHHSIELDLSGVTELDSAGFQQLYLLEREALRMKRRVSIAALSPVAGELFDLYGVQGFLQHPTDDAPGRSPERAADGPDAQKSEAPRPSNFDAVLPTFILEAAELLDGLETAILALSRAPENLELIHSAFRAVHTIKGAAGLFDFARVVRFAHAVESLLAQLRTRTASTRAWRSRPNSGDGHPRRRSPWYRVQTAPPGTTPTPAAKGASSPSAMTGTSPCNSV
jgi:anti-anti-sigma regulatory factor/HPt (histidine-containing phosphotransfer) domain-containing protein